MDYKFSDGLNRVFKQSKNEARRLQSEFLNTEHFLLGIIKNTYNNFHLIFFYDMIYLNKSENRIRNDDRPKHSAIDTIDDKADAS